MLHIHSSNRLEILAKRLAAVLREPLPDPFEEEIVLIYSQGMERWLSMRLAEHLGVCANVRFPFPVAYLTQLLADLTPGWDAGRARAYETQAMIWSLMEILPSVAAEPDAGPLSDYLGKTRAPGDLALYELAEQVAKVLDRYLIYRPRLPRRWEQGREAPSESWQAQTWRALVQRSGPWRRLDLRDHFQMALARDEVSLASMPKRLSVFGVSSLAPFFLDTLALLAGRLDVHLFFLNPCQEYWGDVLSRRQRAKRGRKRGQEAMAQMEFELSSEPGFQNELLAYFGGLGRDFLDLLLECEPSRGYDEFLEPTGTTLLAALQRDILTLREGAGEIHEAEPSLRLFSCHGRMREVEVLHDVLLDLLERDPTLRPHDIMVMAPSIEEYTPKIHAIFGKPREDERHIPYAVSDRSSRDLSSLAAVFLRLFGLPESRWRANEIVGLIGSEPLRRRFDLTERSLEQMQQWVTDAAIRWGRDGEAKRALGLPAVEQNTWRFGLDRMVLGYALPLDYAALHGGVLPCQEVEGSDADVLAKLIDLWERLGWLENLLADEKTPVEWAGACRQIVARFLPSQLDDQRELSFLAQVFDDLAESALASGHRSPVSARVIRQYLNSRLAETFGGSFLTGGVTFCNLLPMRCLPFRVVILLGMSGQDFPRRERNLSFDLLASQPQRGDRSRGQEDRYLFLEALLAARERFYLFHSGQSARDNSEITPSVFVTQLQDYVERVHGVPPECWLTRHRLQPFSQYYFQEGFTYAREYEVAPAGPATKEAALPEPEEEAVVTLDSLIAFFEHPVAAFFHERFGLREPPREVELSDVEPLEISGLERWNMDQWLLRLVRQGASAQEIDALLRASGWLPHGGGQDREIEELTRRVGEFAERLGRFLEGDPEPPMTIDLAMNDQRLAGEVRGFHRRGLCRFRLGVIRPRDLVRLWIEHLAVQAARNGGLRSHFLGDHPQPWTFDGYPSPHAAKRDLQQLVDLRELGRARPLPLFLRASHAFAQARHQDRRSPDVKRKARDIWRGEGGGGAEGADFYHRLVFDPERLPDGRDFEQASLTLFEPLLRHGHFDGSF